MPDIGAAVTLPGSLFPASTPRPVSSIPGQDFLLPPLPLPLLSGEDLSESIYSFKESPESHYSSSAVTHAPQQPSSPESPPPPPPPTHPPPKRFASYPCQMSYDFSLNLFHNSHHPWSKCESHTAKLLLDDILQMQSASLQATFQKDFFFSFAASQNRMIQIMF